MHIPINEKHKADSGAHLSLSDIASQLPTKNSNAAVMLDRMLRLLASYNILTYSLRTLADGKVERLYGLAPVAKYLVKNEDGVSISALCLMNQDKVLMESWVLEESLLLREVNAFIIKATKPEKLLGVAADESWQDNQFHV